MVSHITLPYPESLVRHLSLQLAGCVESRQGSSRCLHKNVRARQDSTDQLGLSQYLRAHGSASITDQLLHLQLSPHFGCHNSFTVKTNVCRQAVHLQLLAAEAAVGELGIEGRVLELTLLALTFVPSAVDKPFTPDAAAHFPGGL
jgi:hypothetical protein